MQESESLTALYSLTGEMPHRIHVEAFTFLGVVGDVRGKRVLDAACGHGLYTRLVKKGGAERVVGVDLSEPLLDVARGIEAQEPLGVEYIHGDVTTAPDLGAFDCVTAGWLLPFMQTEEQLEGLARSLRKRLAPGGILAGITSSTDLAADRSVYRKYAMGIEAPPSPGDGDSYTVTMLTDPPFSLTAHFWSPSTVERALTNAGFRGVTWFPSRCSPEGVERHGAGFFDEMLAHPVMRFFRCENP